MHSADKRLCWRERGWTRWGREACGVSQGGTVDWTSERTVGEDIGALLAGRGDAGPKPKDERDAGFPRNPAARR